jgi:hypothetical protein
MSLISSVTATPDASPGSSVSRSTTSSVCSSPRGGRVAHGCDAVDGPDLGDQLADVARGRVGDDEDVAVVEGRVARGDLRERAARVGVVGDHLARRCAQREVRERQREDHQHDGDAAHHPPRPAVHPSGQRGEHAFLRGVVADGPDRPTEPGDALEGRAAGEDVPPQHEQRRGERGGRDDGQQDHGHRAERDDREDVGPHEQQTRHADGHGDRGEDDRAAGRRDGRADGLRDPRVALGDARPVVGRAHERDLLPEPGDDQQPVVDGEPEAEHGHHVDDERLDVGRVREREQRPETEDDRCDGADHRQ